MKLLARMFAASVLVCAVSIHARAAEPITIGLVDEMTGPQAKSTDPEAMRHALLATRGLKDVEGTHNFEPNGDSVHGYNVVKNEKGKVVFIQRIDFPAP